MPGAGRLCDLCGRPYYRRSLTQVWDGQNPGHRAGWHRTTVKACTTCAPARVAQRALLVSTLRVVASAPMPAAQRKRTQRWLAALRRGQYPSAASE